MLNLQHKKCKLRGYVSGQMPKNAIVICEGSLMEAVSLHILRTDISSSRAKTECLDF